MKPLKSVHITNYYHKNSGGISTSFNNLFIAAARHRRPVRLIAPGESESIEDVNEFARIYYVPARRSPIFDKRYRLMMPWQYMPNDSIIRRILLSEMPDILEVTDKYTLSMLGPMIRLNKFKQLGRPLVIHFSCERMDDNVRSFLGGGAAGKWLARLLMGNYILPGFDYHIANSAYTAGEMYDSIENPRPRWFFGRCWRWLAAPRVSVGERVYVCPRGVDAEQFSPENKDPQIRSEMCGLAQVPENAVLLLYAGRLSPEKNVSLLVDLMKNLHGDDTRDYRLLIAGAGPLADWLQAQGDAIAPKTIVQLGHVDKGTLARYYANADIFVHPNPCEPFGIAPLEAMASGVPTLAPDAGGIKSYATNENAWLVEPNAEAFADAVRSIVDHPEITIEKVKRAIETARANTREMSTDRLVKTYDKMYADFTSRRELFTDREAAKKFDYFDLTGQ